MKESDLMAILRIGHEVSMRGKGISLKQALEKTRYKKLRPEITEEILLPLIISNPSIIIPSIISEVKL